MSLSKISEMGNVDESPQERNRPLAAFISFFHIRFSGTHATVEQRLRVIESSLLSIDAKAVAKLGCER